MVTESALPMDLYAHREFIKTYYKKSIIRRLIKIINLYGIIIVLNLSIAEAQNSAVKVNASVQLVCNATYFRGVFWPVGEESPTKAVKFDINQEMHNNQSYRLVVSNSTNSLTLLSLEENQAGTYICVDPKESAAVISNVIVLGAI